MADVIHFIKSTQPVNYSAVTGPLIQERNLGSDTSGTIGGTFNPLYDGRFGEQYAYLTVSGDFYTINGRPIAMSGDSAGGATNADTLDNQHGYYYLDRANSSGTFQTLASGNVGFVAPSGRFTTLNTTNLYASQVVTSTAFVTSNSTITDLTYSRATPIVTNWATQGNNVTINWSSTHTQSLPMSGNCALAFTAPGSPCRLQLILTQDAVGNRVPTWPATVKWPGGVAPTLTTSPSGIDIIAFWYNGSNYLGTSALDFR